MKELNTIYGLNKKQVAKYIRKMQNGRFYF